MATMSFIDIDTLSGNPKCDSRDATKVPDRGGNELITNGALR